MTFRIFLTTFFAAILGLSVTAPVAKAGSLITAADVGWYNSEGSHLTFAKGFTMGYAGAYDGLVYRAYFDFNLAGITQTISGAQLQIYADSGAYDSPNASEKLVIYDVTTPVQTLKGPAGGAISTFNDLGSGTAYGQTYVSAAKNNSWVSVNLNATAVNALNAARGSEFAMGGAIPSLNMLGTSINELLFVSSSSVSQVRLNLTFAAPLGSITGASVSTPEPSSVMGAVVALGLTLAARRVRRGRAS